MELFGFPSIFMKWIEACITTPSFSVGLNGKPHGFFKGARGLQQGDPLSRYLFVLVMEVLHLGLDRFAKWSGLKLNVQKSQLIISRSAQGLREEMLAALGFQEGVLPLRCDRTSIWIEWLYQGRLRNTSIWTIKEHGGSWGWPKILRLRVFLRPMVDYQIGDGMRFYLWQDPWHYLGPLSDTFPRGPRLLGLEESAKLSMVISGGEWHWPPITDFECLEITHALPTIHGGEDRIVWRFDHGQPTAQALYRLFDPP
ncbi:uncharacterized protein LOC105180194 [Sesamum indicum]|uniref:Uncharacterized protein LOC105180194 n=1 Tax=Sesamum indicum TaxID=4182 RepID=A0A6I9UQW8_SESIN|nr:uncharacterized protein LOC105180194 [Sesamum indicum]